MKKYRVKQSIPCLFLCLTLLACAAQGYAQNTAFGSMNQNKRRTVPNLMTTFPQKMYQQEMLSAQTNQRRGTDISSSGSLDDIDMMAAASPVATAQPVMHQESGTGFASSQGQQHVANLMMATPQTGTSKTDTSTVHQTLPPTPDAVSFYSTTLTEQVPLDPGSAIETSGEETMHLDGSAYTVRNTMRLRTGLYVSDDRGGYIWMDSSHGTDGSLTAMSNAQELKLKIREMATQLMERGSLPGGSIAMPTSFVQQDSFDRSSAFGRYIAEQMFYELNQLGVSVKEYRLLDRIYSAPAQGDFFLSRQTNARPASYRDPLVLVGTYYADTDAVFINARLVRPEDGFVLRTALLVFPQNPMITKMMAKNAGIRLNTVSMEIKSFKEVKDETSVEYILQEGDLH